MVKAFVLDAGEPGFETPHRGRDQRSVSIAKPRRQGRQPPSKDNNSNGGRTTTAGRLREDLLHLASSGSWSRRCLQMSARMAETPLSRFHLGREAASCSRREVATCQRRRVTRPTSRPADGTSTKAMSRSRVESPDLTGVVVERQWPGGGHRRGQLHPVATRRARPPPGAPRRRDRRTATPAR